MPDRMARCIIACTLLSAAMSGAYAQPTDGSADAAPPQDAPAQQAAPPADAADAATAVTPPSTEAAAEPPAPVQEAQAATIPVTELHPAPAQEAQAAEEAPHRLEDVVVTATKRTKSLRDLPQSISAFDGETLERKGKMNLSDYIQETPGVVANDYGSGLVQVTMRGITTDTSPLSPIPSAVGFFIGDTSFTDPYINGVTPDLSAFDLADVEVLKGPQGTLFGGAALAGAIRYQLQEPVIGEWQAKGFGQYVTIDQGSPAWTEGGALNVPLWTDHDLAARVVYVKRNYGGVYDDFRSGQKDVNRGGGDQVRATLLWQPADWKFKLTHLTQDFSTPNGANTTLSPDGPRGSGAFLYPEPASNSFSLDTFEGNYNFDAMRLVSLTSYSTKKLQVYADATAVLVGVPPPNYPASAGAFETFYDNSRSIAQELRLQSTSSGDFQWLVGAYLFRYQVNFDLVADTVANQALHQGLGGLFDPVYDDTVLIHAYTDAKAREDALFFDLSEKFWDRLELSGGARLYRTGVSGGFEGNGVLARAANNGQNVNALHNAIDEKGINPRLAATFHFSRDISLYAQAAKGFRFGGVQSVPSSPTNGVPATYQSDSLWNYELGVRTAWLDNTLHADLTGFYIQYRNPQIVQKTQTTSLNFTSNVPGAVSRGLEASVLWLTPLNGLRVSLSGGVDDTYTTKPFKAVTGDTVEPGTQMPGTAKSQYNADLLYVLPVSFMAAGADLGYTYVGKGYSDLLETVPVNDFGTLNATLYGGMQLGSLRPQLSISMSNILNVTTPIAGGSGKSITDIPFTTYTLNPPRALTLRLSLDF
ncbi:MAG TPA: TonB-dependent receptor [Nevskiaceae bacterium]|nr:TonB-dependent receptor [Nevskiaceae bacterium]